MKKLISMLLIVATSSLLFSCSDILGESYSDFLDNTGVNYYYGTLKVFDADGETTFAVTDVEAILEVTDGIVEITMSEILFDASMDMIDLYFSDIEASGGEFTVDSYFPLVDSEEQEEHELTNISGYYSESMFALSFYYGDYHVAFAGICE